MWRYFRTLCVILTLQWRHSGLFCSFRIWESMWCVHHQTRPNWNSVIHQVKFSCFRPDNFYERSYCPQQSFMYHQFFSCPNWKKAKKSMFSCNNPRLKHRLCAFYFCDELSNPISVCCGISISKTVKNTRKSDAFATYGELELSHVELLTWNNLDRLRILLALQFYHFRSLCVFRWLRIKIADFSLFSAPPFFTWNYSHQKAGRHAKKLLWKFQIKRPNIHLKRAKKPPWYRVVHKFVSK